MKERGIDFEYEKRTVSYLLPVRSGSCGDCKSRNVGKRSVYTPDFELRNGVIVESKGYFTGRDRTKLAAVRAQWPELDIRLLFGSNNWISKSHKARYGDWATKQGFKWAVGKKIPPEWCSGAKEDPAVFRVDEVLS